MGETKRQHHVPRTYLKHFASSVNLIHAVEPSSSKPPFQTNIINVCVKKDIYTLEGDTPEQRMLIEEFYSTELEAHYTRVYNILIDTEHKTITREERSLIISTVFTMFFRTARWINLHNSFFDRVLARTFELCVAKGKDKFMMEDEEISIKDKTLKELQKEFRDRGKSAQTFTQLDVAMRLIKLRANDGISVVKIEHDEAELITSDQPVVMSNLRKGILAPFDPTNMVELPLDPKHKLIIHPHSNISSPEFIARDVQQGDFAKLLTFTSNHIQFETVDKHLLGSKKGLLNFEKTRSEFDRPMTEEENKNMTDIDSIMKKMRDLGLL